MQKNFYFKSTRKRAQSEIITTILIILVGIAAVAILSAFILNMVRTNLKGTECFKTLGELEINLENGWTFYHNPSSGDKLVYVNVERGTKDLDLVGFNIAYGDGSEFKSVTLKNNEATTDVKFVKGFSGTSLLLENTIVLPAPGESKTYRITSSIANPVTKVIIAPIIGGGSVEGSVCKQVDEKEIPTRTTLPIT
ncbi:hypothetical protein FJZ17_04485 [Candidatus Pacearchaeota archaeon]|nr:hypothetical protein [Candidatus Pacearchaeota archaeon]